MREKAEARLAKLVEKGSIISIVISIVITCLRIILLQYCEAYPFCEQLILILFILQRIIIFTHCNNNAFSSLFSFFLRSDVFLFFFQILESSALKIFLFEE